MAKKKRRKRKMLWVAMSILGKKRARKRKAKHKRAKRGCGKRKWARGGNAYWKCKKGAKKHSYGKRQKKSRRKKRFR